MALSCGQVVALSAVAHHWRSEGGIASSEVVQNGKAFVVRTRREAASISSVGGAVLSRVEVAQALRGASARSRRPSVRFLRGVDSRTAE
jgi:hypothetical protein